MHALISGISQAVEESNRKMTSSKNNYNSDNFQKFLDEQQYNKNGILRYEMIFGETYVSTGGQDTTTKFCNDLELKVGHTQQVPFTGWGI